MYGLEIRDESGEQILGMGDFSMRKIYQTTVPGIAQPWTNNIINNPYVLNIPGYDANNCFVLITPTAYEAGDQDQADQNLLIPCYVDLGGTSIGIIRYVNLRNGASQYWTRACIVEVFAVFGSI